MAISPDGLRIVHYKTKSKRYVLRELTTGGSATLPAVPPGSLSPAFSLDSRHLAIEEDLFDKDDDFIGNRVFLVPNAGRDTVRHRIAGELRGWTADGVVTAITRPARIPGHLSQTVLTVTAPTGRTVRELVLPANLGQESVLSPDGRTLAAVRKEVTPHTVIATGVSLIDADSGRTTRVVSPAVPEGWAPAEVVRWVSPEALLLKLRPKTPSADGPIGHHVLDLTTGLLRPVGVDGALVADPFFRPLGDSIAIGHIK